MMDSPPAGATFKQSLICTFTKEQGYRHIDVISYLHAVIFLVIARKLLVVICACGFACWFWISPLLPCIDASRAVN